MKIKSLTLLKAIEPLLPVTQGRNIIPITRCLRMEVVLGRLKILATNTVEYSERTVECDEKKDINPFCVDASRLSTVLSRETAEVVGLEIDGGWLNYKGSAAVKFAVLDAAEFPPFPDQKMESIGLNCEDLADHVDSVEWVTSLVSKDALLDRPIFGTVNIVTSARIMSALATNGSVGAIRESAAICSDSNFSVPREHIGAFCAALRAEESDLLVGENHVAVTFLGGRWLARMIDSKFPTEQFLKLMRGEHADVGSMSTKELIPHLEIANQFINPQKWEPATIGFEKSGATLHFSCPDSDYECEIEGKFDEGVWKIDPRQLYLALKHFKPESRFTIKCDEVKHLISDGVLDVLVCNIR